jgi:hypothetical protein
MAWWRRPVPTDIDDKELDDLKKLARQYLGGVR